MAGIGIIERWQRRRRLCYQPESSSFIELALLLLSIRTNMAPLCQCPLSVNTKTSPSLSIIIMPFQNDHDGVDHTSKKRLHHISVSLGRQAAIILAMNITLAVIG
mmetsp:Transcript_31449/g.66606  ORF Transcript_31449/g.66606 Transcript_31449/m.66606 type:complete len:105 (+) Transcript_31449:253-567(+)